MAQKRWKGDDASTPYDWSVAGNWEPSGVPTAGDDVRIPAGSLAITAGLNQSAVALGDVIVEEGYSSLIGSADGDLQIDPNRFEFAGSAVAYIDIGSAAINVTVKKTAQSANGIRGLYLIGSAISVLNVSGGDVGFASVHGTSAAATTVRASGGKLYLGEGVSTITTLSVSKSGQVCLFGSATTVNAYAGTLTTDEQGTIGTLNVDGGNVDLRSTGTITTCNINGGTVTTLNSGEARTITTLNLNVGANFSFDPAVLTITNRNLESGEPAKYVVSKGNG